VIAVGIDCPIDPVERMQELCPPYVPKKEIVFKKGGEPTNTYADKFIDYIINNIKPLVDKLFYTLKDREHTAIGGSSMGGLMSGYAYIYRPDIFGFALVFSPAFFFYKLSDCKKAAKSLGLNPKNNGQIFLYTGGKGFEAQFLEDTVGIYNFLKELSFENHQVKLIVDSDAEHNEIAWAKVLPLALKFWLKN
ncbi:MAG: hypothetical protein HUJ59_05740, partial [Bacilli bacterium]|nr:hypothetical protein [Bacilli bacterium]